MKPVALTIAGSDSGGGAGIQADIKTMEAHGVFATSVLTAVTAQNSVKVVSAFDLPLELIRQQIEAVVTDFPVRVVKIGMLSSAAIIETVAASLERHRISQIVLDPVMISKSGFALLKDEAIDMLINRLIPLARVLTPNVHEAERLTGSKIVTLSDAREAARQLMSLGPESVVVKGGHLDGKSAATDIFFDGQHWTELSGEFHDTANTHGTGCTFSASIAANLARGQELLLSVKKAKAYVDLAIRHGMSLGEGHGPTSHFYFLDESPPVG